MEATPAADRAAGHVPAADGVRGLACLLVLALHAVVIFFPATTIFLAGTPKYGVWLFFVLSAFLLTIRFAQTGFSPRAIVAYAWSRSLRIVPLYLLAVCVYYIFGSAGIDSASDLKKALLMQAGYAHLWTVPVEFKFYAALPVLAYLALALQRNLGAGAALAALLLLIGVSQSLFPFALTPVFGATPESVIELRWYLGCFITGIAAAIAWLQRPVFTPMFQSSAVAVILVALVAASPLVRQLLLGMEPMDDLKDKHLFLGAAWAVFVILVCSPSSLRLAACFDARVLTSMGRWSYPIYLFHWLVIVKSAELFPSNALAMVLAAVTSIALGAIVQRGIDTPLRKRLQWPKPGARAGLAGPA